jgi:hypothetical protein
LKNLMKCLKGSSYLEQREMLQEYYNDVTRVL